MNNPISHINSEQITTFADSADNVQIITNDYVYRGFFQYARCCYRHRRFDGDWQEVVREVHIRHDAVGVLLYDPLVDAIVVVEQIRAGVLLHNQEHHLHHSPWLLEPVAGLIDHEGATPLEIAYREVVEETGCQVDKLEYLFSYFASPGASTERAHLFYALVDSRQFHGVHGLTREREDIRLHVIDFQRAQQYFQEGQLDNAMMILLLQWLTMARANLRAQI